LISTAAPCSAARRARVHVHRVRLALEQQPPRGVAEHGEERVGHGAAHARRHLRLAEVEARVHRADHVVEERQRPLVVVEGPVGEDVALDPLEHAEVDAAARVVVVHAVDLAVLLAHARRREAARVRRGLRVVGDAHVAPPARARRLGHLEHARRAVRVGGVAVDGAAQVRGLHQLGDAPRGRVVHLARALAQLGHHVRQAGEPVHVGFVAHGDQAPSGPRTPSSASA
jgi:hypothetical protein